MRNVTVSELRSNLSELLSRVRVEPIRVLSRGTREYAVMVSPEFYARAAIALDIEGVEYADAELTESEMWELEIEAMNASWKRRKARESHEGRGEE